MRFIEARKGEKLEICFQGSIQGPYMAKSLGYALWSPLGMVANKFTTRLYDWLTEQLVSTEGTIGTNLDSFRFQDEPPNIMTTIALSKGRKAGLVHNVRLDSFTNSLEQRIGHFIQHVATLDPGMFEDKDREAHLTAFYRAQSRPLADAICDELETKIRHELLWMRDRIENGDK